MLATNIVTKWVNSDRQLADVLTKPQVPTLNCLTLQRTGRWKIVFDESESLLNTDSKSDITYAKCPTPLEKSIKDKGALFQCHEMKICLSS